MLINSPGGSISDGMAIHDTMNYIKCDVSTICVGMAASVGSFLLASGTKASAALPNSKSSMVALIGGALTEFQTLSIYSNFFDIYSNKSVPLHVFCVGLLALMYKLV